MSTKTWRLPDGPPCSVSFVLTVDFQHGLALGRAHVVGGLHGELAGDAATRAADDASVEPFGILERGRKNEVEMKGK